MFLVTELKNLNLVIKCGKKIADKIALGERVFHWLDWDNKFGFNDLEYIKNTDAISAYVTKYITKDLQKSVKELNAHTYYCSKGLNKANTLNAKKIDLSSVHKLKPDFSNEYCSLYWLNENQINSLMSFSNDNLLQNTNCSNSSVVLDI